MKPPYPMSEKRPLIRDRGRGPELVNSRITVFDLLPNLMDPARTDAEILAWYPTIDRTQLAAVRAYALEYAERLLPEQREWEARPEPRNPPEVAAQRVETRERFRLFREWVDGGGTVGPTQRDTFARFRAWLARRAPELALPAPGPAVCRPAAGEPAADRPPAERLGEKDRPAATRPAAARV